MNTTNGSRGIDLPDERRPGVPAEREPHPVGNAHWSIPERQTTRRDLTIDAQRLEPTATFGTGQPPRGLSGVMRRAAYRTPDYDPKRWALLLLADRVDAVEDRALALARSPLMWVALLAGASLVAARLAPRRRPLLARLFG